jgi:hypothetical protein
MKKIFGLAIAASVLALGAPAMAATTLVNSTCTLSVGTSCLFNGNITTQLTGNNSLGAADTAYNSQSPTPSPLLDLAGMANILDAPGINTNATSGVYTSSFEVTYYAVKAGDFFDLFEVAPTKTIDWSTSGISVGKGQTPDISHLLVFGPAGGVPEPATWAMMIGGLAMVGSVMRRRRQTAVAA